MSEIFSSTPFPRGPLLTAGGMVVAVVIAVAAVRLSGVEIRHPDAPAVVTQQLRFEDRPDGSIAVYRANDNVLIESITGQSGFVRGTLRGMARERRRQDVDNGPPFELIGRADGRLTLRDPSTGRIVDLESFGPINAGEFARLLALAVKTPQ
jgi:putative photosynthetic complex assembly protein